MDTSSFSIAAVERDTGLSKDVLRMWERRYGFPVPARDGNGERMYSANQLERLRMIKRLMDQGHRPGKLVGLSAAELAVLAPRRVVRPAVAGSDRSNDDLEKMLGFITEHNAAAYQQAMQQRLARQGLQRFVQDAIAPLSQIVGEAWEEGRIQVFEEHLFTEATKRLLRHAIASLPPPSQGPRVLLTSVPDEQHALGLLMAEALLTLEGADCIALGTQTPLQDIVNAAAAHRADVVALSFSGAFPARQIPALMQQLRQMLPANVALWIGGTGIRRVAAIAGVRCLNEFDEAIAAVAEWRANTSR